MICEIFDALPIEKQISVFNPATNIIFDLRNKI